MKFNYRVANQNYL